jgi:SAM-dependent methyltransferase
MIMDALTDLTETTGCLDVVAIEGDTVRISGWAAAFDGTPVDGMEVSWRGERLTLLELETGMASADVTAANPKLPRSAACRFRLVARAPEQRRDILLTVVPRSAGRDGRRLFQLIEPALPQPPQEHITAIGGSFLNIGLLMLDYFIAHGRLRPDERVLDVGCGVGRIAYALAYYLNDRGRYDGFDVMSPLVEWAKANITAQRANFRFQHVNVRNQMYNPSGDLSADTFRFPYPDASFDFVTLISVFTHIPGQDVRHYLDEIARVLAPGGRVMVTAFVLDDEVRALISDGRSTLPIVHRHGEGFIADLDVPEAAVGYDEQVLRHWIEASGLRMVTPFPGSWCGRARGLTYQDLLLIELADHSRYRWGARGNPLTRLRQRLRLGRQAGRAFRARRVISSVIPRWFTRPVRLNRSIVARLRGP